MHSFTAIVATVLTAIIAVEAGPQHMPMGNYARHAAVIRRTPAPKAAPVADVPKWSKSRRGLSRRCKSRPHPDPAPATPAPSNGGSGSGNGGNNGGSSGNGGNNGGNSGNSGNGGSSGGSGGSGGNPSGGMINFSWGGCPVNPTPDSGNDAGPNGAEAFMNCGLNNGGWQPPNVQLSDLVYHPSLRDAVNEPGSPFTACSSLVDAFEQAASQTGVPAILLASFAMQESSCQPGVTGGAGEIGLMQITPDKCPQDGSNCYDPITNLNIGANYFKNVLDSHNGNVFQACGEYNGWYQGMQPGDVVNRPCAQQQNLDYLHHMFNYWMQNRDPNGAGTERNKQACGGY